MRSAKSDSNQAKIVAALRQVGCVVTDTHRLGDGFPDVFCFVPSSGQIHVLEIKSPGGKLTKRERAWHALHARCEYVHIVYGVEEAFEACGVKVV